MDSHALKVKQNLHSKNAFSWRYTLFLVIIISSKTILINISTSIKLWDINDTSEPIAKFTGDSSAFSLDGNLLAICDLWDGVKLWDINKKKFINTPNYMEATQFFHQMDDG